MDEKEIFIVLQVSLDDLSQVLKNWNIVLTSEFILVTFLTSVRMSNIVN